MSSPNAAILFEPDGYVIDRAKLMGRHSAGNGFLRAAVAGLRGQTLYAYTPRRKSAETFGELVASIDPQAQHKWVGGDRLDMLAEIGALYMPGPNLSEAARLRMRAGVGAYSIVGVTHTTATHRASDSITDMLSAPVMPWDALICTSQAVKSHVTTLLEAQTDYLQWRLGVRPQTLPQLPVIPLGVHCEDFASTAAEKEEARRALGIADDEVVALFVGRLSFHAKAHPHAMYIGLEAAARQTGKKTALVQCGWFGTENVEKAFKDGAARFCPSVRALFTDGRDTGQRKHSWAAADLFISLSDNIQETFGLTPIEAMAAGLPVVVTDWDGYKETVTDGLDGYRIRTFMPGPGFGDSLARAYEAGIHNYDFYTGLSSQLISVDLEQLARRLADLIADPALRRRMGESGREYARAEFDWSVVFKRYLDLWGQLAEIRSRATRDKARDRASNDAPKSSPGRIDPFQAFATYPTHLLGPQTRMARVSGTPSFKELATDPLFMFAGPILPKSDVVDRIEKAVSTGTRTIQQVSTDAGLGIGITVRAVAVLAKMGLVRLGT